MSIMTDIKETETSARKVHGADIEILLARAPAFGHDDCCLIIRGAKHATVAADLARFAKGAKTTEQKCSGFMDIPPSTYSTIEFPALQA